MSRKPTIPPAKRRQWLERHEHGERQDEIARKDGVNPRTVSEQIQRARQEREAGEVRAGLLLDAYQRHFEDMLAVAQEVRERSNIPNPNGLLPGFLRKTAMLWDALRRHIPKAELWKACRDWEDHARQMDTATHSIQEDISKLVEQQVRASFPEAKPDWFAGDLWYAAEQTARGQEKMVQRLDYAIDRTAEGQQLRWGGRILTDRLERPDQARLKNLQETHKQLVHEVMSWESVTGLADIWERWTRARDAIDEQVEILLLRRMLPGQCFLCPGSEGTGDKKSRRWRDNR